MENEDIDKRFSESKEMITFSATKLRNSISET